LEIYASRLEKQEKVCYNKNHRIRVLNTERIGFGGLYAL